MSRNGHSSGSCGPDFTVKPEYSTSHLLEADVEQASNGSFESYGDKTPSEVEVASPLSPNARKSMAQKAQELFTTGQARLSRNEEKRPSVEDAPGGKQQGVFVDAAAMKEKVRQNLTKKRYSVSDLYKKEGWSQRVARSPVFENLTLGVIAFNALWIAIDTDYNSASMLLDAHPVFQIAENCFCLFFAFEWLVRFLSFKRKIDSLKDAWFLFDSFLVLSMVLETWVLTAWALFSGAGGGGGVGNMSILRIARLLRLSRMARMARLLRAMPELMVLIKGMLAATRSVFFTLCLLILIMYVFAIAFTQLCAETPSGNTYFRSVPDSMYNLLIYGALLDNVSGISNDLGADSPLFVGIFFLFSLLAALTVMNMLIGVLCEVVSAVAAVEKEESMVAYVNEKLRQVVHLLDEDGDKRISKNEFVELLENVDAARALQEVGVDVVGLIDFADFIFQDDTIEGEGSETERDLSFGDFMEVVLQLRGSNNATVKDIVDLRKFMRHALVQQGLQIKKQTSTILEELIHQVRAQHSDAVGMMRQIESFRKSEHSSTRSHHEPPAGWSSKDHADNMCDLAVIKAVANKTNGIAAEKLRSEEFSVCAVEGGPPAAPLPTSCTPLLRALDEEIFEDESIERIYYLQDFALQGQWHPLDRQGPASLTVQQAVCETSPMACGNNASWQNGAAPTPRPELACHEHGHLHWMVTRLGKALGAGVSEFLSLQEAVAANHLQSERCGCSESLEAEKWVADEVHLRGGEDLPELPALTSSMAQKNRRYRCCAGSGDLPSPRGQRHL